MTPKQARFVGEHLIDLNATAAARRSGYSVKTAEQQGPRLLGNVGVAAAIAEAQEARAERTLISQDEVIIGLRTEAVYRGDGASHGARVSAWAHLGRHLGMFEDKNTFDGTLTVNIVRFSRDDLQPLPGTTT